MIRISFIAALHVSILYPIGDITSPKNGGELSNKQIALITVSVVVGCITALGAVYVIRYDEFFVS